MGHKQLVNQSISWVTATSVYIELDQCSYELGTGDWPTRTSNAHTHTHIHGQLVVKAV